MTPGGIVTRDGGERPADVIVLATGFKATEYLEGIEVVGVGGRKLHDDWAEVAHAYLGLTVSGYPNFFMLYGPNTNQGGNSIIIILEAQAAYVVSALRAMRWRRVPAVDVRRDVMEQYNRELARGAGGYRLGTAARATSRTPTARSRPSSPRPQSGMPREPSTSG